LEYVDFFAHIAMLLFIISFIVTDMYYLRLIALFAIIFEIIYLYMAPDNPLWVFIVWDLIFLSVNIFQIIRLIKQNQTISFTDIEKELFDTMFSNFSKLEFLKLLRVGTWKTLDAGIKITESGQNVKNVHLIFNGIVEVYSQGERIYTLKDGQLIGEMSFMNELPATATTITLTQTKLISWDQDQLRLLLKRNPTLQYAMERVFNKDLISKMTQ